MKTTLIIGASGQVGKIILQTLASTDKPVRALVRDKSKLSDLALENNIDVVEMDLESDFSAAFKDVDQVIFTAGSGAKTGADKTLLIDLWAAKKAVDYAKEYKIEHFTMISGIGAHDPDDLPTKIKPYLIAKHMADEYLIRSDVPYTILRPGPLTNEPGIGKISTKRPSTREAMAISREDVAKATIYTLGNEGLKGKIFELFGGTYDFDKILA